MYSGNPDTVRPCPHNLGGNSADWTTSLSSPGFCHNLHGGCRTHKTVKYESPEKNWFVNIAKGTTDPRVDITSCYTNLDQTSISESLLSINFKISTKRQYLD